MAQNILFSSCSLSNCVYFHTMKQTVKEVNRNTKKQGNSLISAAIEMVVGDKVGDAFGL